MLVILALLSAITKCEIELWRSPQIDSICGHYVEWGGQSSDPAVTHAHQSQIDVGKHREYCQLE